MTVCPGTGRPPAPPKTWRTGVGGVRRADERATCPVCGKRLAHRADGRVRRHEPRAGQPAPVVPPTPVRRRVVTQK
ncbi:hypothetical protein SEA_KNOCKER_85 [Mycobacterium phage Knocker]|nr:hypothetical protein SEA_KNOCKER_85 [Mycobacterium phage Knocker]